jgi:hypothetical protein
MRARLPFAAALTIALALPLAAETVTERLGATEVTTTLARLPGHPSFQAFLQEDGAAIADDYAADNARTVQIEDRVTQKGPRFASVLRRIQADLGGAHPNTYLEALVWDDSTQDFVRLDAFFDPGAPRDEALIVISRYLRETIRTKVWSGKIDPIFLPLVEQATNPDPAVMSNFTLEASGLAFHFSPYEVAPYSAGPISILVPRREFAAWLNTTGSAALP